MSKMHRNEGMMGNSGQTEEGCYTHYRAHISEPSGTLQGSSKNQIDQKYPLNTTEPMY